MRLLDENSKTVLLLWLLKNSRVQGRKSCGLDTGDSLFLGNGTVLCRSMCVGTLLSPTFSASHILSASKEKKSVLPHGSIFHITGFDVLGHHGKGDRHFVCKI